jgi:hypothetical protein
MRQFVTISLDQMRTAFSKQTTEGKGWVESKAGRNEVVFDFSLAPACTLRVWTSIRNDNGLSRDRGDDAIRVAAFNPLNGKGLVKASYVQRIETWENNLRARIKTVAETAKKRLASGFDGSRR